MPTTLELVDKTTGNLGPRDVMNSEITKILSELFIYVEMLAPERQNEKCIILDIRNHLLEIRRFASEHLDYVPKKDA